MKRYLFLLGLLVVPFLQFCNKTTSYQAVNADYVGKEACISCHSDIWETFQHTGMGKSFGKATREKSSAIFSEECLIYDSLGKFYYKPFWENDSLKVLEFRLKGKDTIHKLVFPVHYIIGSGQHTNSHLYQIHGYLFQIPVTFYTQKKVWDMAPGFETNNTRFFRKIGLECMTCHNAMPEFDFSSGNKFLKIPEGIDCERCHGPGSLHVREKQAGNLVDTSKNTDYSIVNPRKLSKEKQMSICMRCHLQGITVLKEGKKFTDFVPSEHLNDFLYTFVPAYEDSQTFWMASHVERLMQSACYQNSDMSCISCHNPHISVKETEDFNVKCVSCHSVKHYDNNCIECHMPKSASADIPHVAITDHKIGVYLQQKTRQNVASSYVLPAKLKYVGLRKPGKKETLRAYLKYFDAYKAPRRSLDIASNFIDEQTAFSEKIYYYYLREEYEEIIAMTEKESPVEDAWTNYRIGEAFFQKKRFPEAEKYLRKAVEKQKNNLDFRLRLSRVLILLKKTQEAEKELQFILKENPLYYEAWFLLGGVQELIGKTREAEACYQKAIRLFPDHTQAVLNLAKLYIKEKNKEKAKKLLENFLYFNSDKEAELLLKVLS